MTDPALPMKSIKVPVTGSLRADLEKQTADADIKALMDMTSERVQSQFGIALETEINQIAGVVTVGLFARRPADVLLVGTAHGVVTLTRAT